jgi:hypothetical protein
VGHSGVGEVLILPIRAWTAERRVSDGRGKLGLDWIEASIVHKENRVKHAAVDGEVDVMRAGWDLDFTLVPLDVTPTARTACAASDRSLVHVHSDLAVTTVLSYPNLPEAVDRKVGDPRQGVSTPTARPGRSLARRRRPAVRRPVRIEAPRR